MKYSVYAEIWTDVLKGVFGEEESVHELSDADVILHLIRFGCAEVADREDGIRLLNFVNVTMDSSFYGS